jgi:hypothetical protein
VPTGKEVAHFGDGSVQLRTGIASLLELKVPPMLLARADEVIE